jgi:hypothetical protein
MDQAGWYKAKDLVIPENIRLIIMGKPPALPGDSQSLTFPGK